MIIFIHVIIWIAFAISVIGGALYIFLGDVKKASRIASVVGTAFVLFVLALMMSVSLGQVEAGERGVVLEWGAVTSETKGEGIYIVTPFAQRVHTMSVQTEAYEAAASAASKDLQDVQTVVTLNFSLDPGRVNDTYQELRDDYIIRIVRPGVQEAVKAVTARYNAEELITERPAVRDAIEEILAIRLDEHGMIIDTVNITDFQFSQTFTASIEAKVVADQKAKEAENKLKQIIVEAEQTEEKAIGVANALIAQAEGDKQAAITRAEGEAEAILEVAEAQAEANTKLNATITDILNEYNLVNGLGPNINWGILPTGSEFILGEEVLSKHDESTYTSYTTSGSLTP